MPPNVSHLRFWVPWSPRTHDSYSTVTYIAVWKSSLELISWVLCFFVLLTQILMGDSNQSLSLMDRLRIYISSYWNRIDCLCLFLILVGAPLTNIGDVKPLANSLGITTDILHDIGRALLIISLLLYFVRLLYVFCIHKTFGPKIVMMGRMVQFCPILYD